MTKPRLYVSRVVRPGVLARLSESCETRAWPGPGRPSAEVLEREVVECDAVLGTERWTAELMDKCPKLRLIAGTAVGYDNVDVAGATERGIIVTNTAGALTDTVADLVFGLLLGSARRISEMDRWVRAGNWRTAGITDMGWDVHHGTLGIVGLGRIGVAVAERALGFRMKVLYYDTYRREDLEKQYGYRFVEMDRLLAESDFITLHTALTPETRGMIGDAAFGKMKPTAFLVNTSRGPVVDEAALIRALKDGKIAGAGLDVFEKEPVDPENPLLKTDNVVVLPHVGSATAATRQAMVDLAADNVLAVMKGEKPLTSVNPDVLSRLKK